MNMRSLRSASIGSISAWLPSRRSTLHQTGGLEMTWSGHVRSANATGAKGRYFWDGILFMVALALNVIKATAAGSSLAGLGYCVLGV